MATGNDQRSLRISTCSSSGGKVLKLSKLMGVLILAGFLQDAQDVLMGGAAAEQVIVEQVSPD
ncbi:MAG: hypothetical protein ACYCUV_04410 [Phycisphaerae bacterium]